MKKVLITAALLAGMCGLAVAQGGAGGEPPKASDLHIVIGHRFGAGAGAR